MKESLIIYQQPRKNKQLYCFTAFLILFSLPSSIIQIVSGLGYGLYIQKCTSFIDLHLFFIINGNIQSLFLKAFFLYKYKKIEHILIKSGFYLISITNITLLFIGSVILYNCYSGNSTMINLLLISGFTIDFIKFIVCISNKL